MLALQLLAVFLMRGAGWGQGNSFSPVEYNFPNGFGSIGKIQSNAVVDNTYTDKDGNTHPFSIVSSASNGYGTWAATNDGRWLLIGNNLATEGTPDAAHSQPSGIIAS